MDLPASIPRILRPVTVVTPLFIHRPEEAEVFRDEARAEAGEDRSGAELTGAFIITRLLLSSWRTSANASHRDGRGLEPNKWPQASSRSLL